MNEVLRVADGFAHIVRMMLAKPEDLTIDVVQQPGAISSGSPCLRTR
jgi:hypothetical protein